MIKRNELNVKLLKSDEADYLGTTAERMHASMARQYS